MRYFTAHVHSLQLKSGPSVLSKSFTTTLLPKKVNEKMSLAHNGLPLSSRCLRRASSSSPVAPAVSSIPTSAHSCTSFSISGSARGALNFAHGFGSSDFGVSNFGPTVLGFAGAYTFGYAMFRIRNSDSHLILIDPHLKKYMFLLFIIDG